MKNYRIVTILMNAEKLQRKYSLFKRYEIAPVAALAYGKGTVRGDGKRKIP